MPIRYALVLCLFGTACATDDYDGARQGGRSLEKELCPTGCSDDIERGLASSEFEDVGGGAYVSAGAQEIEFAPACTQLPSTGLCSAACDPDRLGKLIPTGTCTTIACGLNDGRTLFTRACGYEVSVNLTTTPVRQ